MTEAGGQARHPAHSPPVGAKWRPGSGRSSPNARRRRRALFAFVILLGLGGILAMIVSMFVVVGRDVPPLQWVGIGISSYDEFPPRSGSLRDVDELTNLFTTLSEFRPEEFAPPISMRDSLTRESLLSTLRREMAGQTGRNVAVYLSLHTIADPDGAAQLVAIHAGVDTVQGSATSELIPLSDVLNVLVESPATNILLFVEAGRLHPDSRLGILGADGVAALSRLIESLNSPKLRVLCACSAGEESWTLTEASTSVSKPTSPTGDQKTTEAAATGPRTIFGLVLQQALSGDCDGWQKDSQPDRAIDWNEISSYLTANVEEKTSRRYGERQTVLNFGPGSPLDLMLLRDVTAGPADKDGTAAEAGEGSQADSPASAEVAKTTSAADKPSEEAQSKPLTPAAVRSEIDEYWLSLERATNGQANPADGRQRLTRKWRFLLLRSEEQLESGLLAAARETLSQIDQLLASAMPPQVSGETATFDPSTLSATWWALSAPTSTPLPTTEIAKWRKAAEELIKKGMSPEPAAAPMPAAAPGAPTPPSPWADQSNRHVFARYVWDEMKTTGSVNRNAGFLLSQLQKEGWPSSEWPVEFLLMDHLTRRSNREQTAGLELRYLAAIDRLQKLMITVWPAPQTFLQIQKPVDEIQHSLLAAERWLMTDPCPERFVVQWLEQAEKKLGETNAKATAWSTLSELRLRATRDWPAYAAWIAEEAEAGLKTVNFTKVDSLARFLEGHALLDGEALTQLQADWPIEGERETSASIIALQLLVELQSIEAALAAGQEQEVLDDQEVMRMADSLRGQLDSLDRLFGDEVRRLKNSSSATLADHQEIRRLLRGSLLSLSDRRLLRERLDSRPTESLTTGATGPVSTPQSGLWRGFWSICQQQFTEPDAQRQGSLWTHWRSLGRAVGEKSSEQVSLRAKLGQELNRSWGLLERELSDEAQQLGANRLARLLHGLPGHPALNVEQVQQPFRIAVADQRNVILASLAAPWSHRNYLTSILTRLGAAGIFVTSSSEPSLSIPAEVPCDEQRLGRLELSVLGEAGDASTSIMVFDLGGGRASVRQQASRVPVDTPLPLQQSKAVLDVEAAASLVRSENIGVALVSADGFPHDIRRVSILPPFDKSRFSIRFLTVPRGIPVYQSSGRDGTGARIYLPPQGETALKPVLLRPAGDTTQKMSIKCYSGSRDGQLVYSLDLPLPADVNQVEMVPPPPAEGTPPPAAPMSPASGTVQGVDISQGLVFWLVPDDQPEKGFEFRVEPEFWLPTDFVETPQPVLSKNKIEIPVTSVPRRLNTSEEFDLLNPMQIGVKLELTPSWKEILLPGGIMELPELALGKSGKLQLTVDSEKLEKSGNSYEMTMSVAGWPHAFRWIVSGSGIRRLTSPGVRFSSPADDAVFSPPQQPGDFATNIELQVFGDELDSGYAYNNEWLVEYNVRLKSGSSVDSVSSGGKEWPVYARMIRGIRLQGPTAGIWTIQTDASDFSTSLDLRGKSGQFLLEAKLSKDGVEQATDSILIAVDSSPPIVGFSAIPKRHDYLKELEVKVTAADNESRIRRIRLGLDLNRDQQLSEEEAVWEVFEDRKQDPLARLKSNTFKPQELPQKETAVRFIVEAENRVGMIGRAVAEVDLFTARSMSAGTPSALTEGTLMLQTNNRLGTVNVDGTDHKTSFGKPVPPLTLKVGKYEVKWKGQVVGTVEIKGGETTTFSVPTD